MDPGILQRTLTGAGPRIIERVEQLEAEGVDNLALAANDPEGARELIEDFSREVIKPMGG